MQATTLSLEVRPPRLDRSYPVGYRPLAYCRDCGRDFTGDKLFDRHRVGAHDYTYSEGLRRDPPVEDGRRCLHADELRELGLRPMTDDEMGASRRDRHRAGYGVELWIDPAEVERARRNLRARPEHPQIPPAVAVEATEAVEATDYPTLDQIGIYEVRPAA